MVLSKKNLRQYKQYISNFTIHLQLMQKRERSRTTYSTRKRLSFGRENLNFQYKYLRYIFENRKKKPIVRIRNGDSFV